MHLLVFIQMENCDEDNLNRAKMEGQIRLGKDTAHRFFVGAGKIENFNKFGNQTAVKEYGNDEAKILFLKEKEKSDNQQDGNPDHDKMFCTKQRVVRQKKIHKAPLC